ncbi:MAG: D-alanyl-D-alanine carboxypeptidase/D-alanyl-D-alanine-endopeptidase [Planctomycetes bacterium]|nr:D-alanyl-D-alanine carboxypeptidase/D-alanyl-D-alanine-endopeptidase [Planctomycetota bacterium]
MSRVYRLSQWLIVLVAVVGGVSAIAEDRVPPKVREVMDSAKYKQAHWGLLAVELKTGEVRYELNSEKLFAPASTTKCFSVACALDAFGADHRFETPIVRRGEVNDKGELTGDLILIASGDLTLGGRTTESGEIAFTNGDHTYASGGTESELTPQDPLVGLNELARQVAQAGIKRVRGDVLIDDRLFDKAEGSGSGPGRITPIYVNDNLFDFTITPTKAGQPAEVKWRPESKSFRIETHVETVAKGGKSETSVRDLGSGRIGVSGRIAEAHKPVLRVLEVADASSFARTLLIEALNRQGVDVEALAAADHPADKLPSRDETRKLPSVAKFVSPPFAENARLILKVSHNLHASTLPLLVAAKHGERTLSQGLRRQHDFLKRVGVDVDTISFGGGAGGSRSDYTTPAATVQLLRYMATRPDFDAYRRAMPRLGIDGTLAKSVGAESPARDKVAAKTGTLYWDNVMNSSSLLTSKALAGYMTTSKGDTLAFALFVNNAPLRNGLTTTAAGKDLGRIAELLYE